MRVKERTELGAYGNRIANLGTRGLYRPVGFAETAAGDGEDFGVGKVSGRRRRGLVRCGAGLSVKPLDLSCEVSELYLCLRLSTIVLKS